MRAGFSTALIDTPRSSAHASTNRKYSRKASTTQRTCGQWRRSASRHGLNRSRPLIRNRKLTRLTPNRVTRLKKGNKKAREPIQIRTGSRVFVELLFIDVLVGYSCP
jgi:hypothetical protein